MKPYFYRKNAACRSLSIFIHQAFQAAHQTCNKIKQTKLNNHFTPSIHLCLFTSFPKPHCTTLYRALYVVCLMEFHHETSNVVDHAAQVCPSPPCTSCDQASTFLWCPVGTLPLNRGLDDFACLIIVNDIPDSVCAHDEEFVVVFYLMFPYFWFCADSDGVNDGVTETATHC